MLAKLRRLGYAWIALVGMVATSVPKQLVDLSMRTWLFGFENAGDLEPSDWYVRAVRAMGIGMIAAGLAGLLLEGGRAEDPEPSVEIDAPVESEGV